MGDKFFSNKTLINAVVAALWVSTVIVFAKCYREEVRNSQRLLEEIEFIDTLNNYNRIYYDGQFEELKKVNKELHDSLKKSKDKISYLVQFSYEKTNETGIVYTKPQKQVVKNDTVSAVAEVEPTTFVYNSEPNDTFQYELRINSAKEPNWYSLKTRFKDKFTIVNKDDGNGMNHITIGSGGDGTVSDVTVFKKKEKRKFKDRVSIGPSVTAGYDPFNRNFAVVAGIGVSIDLK